MDVVERQQSEEDRAAPEFPSESPVTPWRTELDPFAHASPVHDLSMLVGGLPDTRTAAEILRDLARCRMKRTQR